jgi:TATA-box binding protein (TBP) (component of TFIID and TFIIIB)
VLYFTKEIGAVLIYSNGKVVNIGSKISPDKVAKAYSQLRKGSHANRTFTIEGVRVPSNHISAMAMQNEGVIY